ncbi:MAG: outer membrane lipoprotein-sorting protein [Bradymonadia bacterium]|jgi:outer membrane lipoprotein-sorting protein
MEHYKRRRLLSRIKAGITVFFVIGVLLRVGLKLKEANGQDLPANVVLQPDEPEQTTIGPGAMPTAEEVMDHLNDLYRSDGAHTRMTMQITTENWERTLEMESWAQGAEQALIVIRAPAREAGTATLKTEEGLWNYAPRADRLMRVPSGMMSEGWMGSHFSNEDVMRESDYNDDYETTLELRDEDGESVLVASSIPLPSAAVVYTRIDYVMTAQAWIPLRAEFYDEDTLIRTFGYSDVQVVAGRPIPMRLEIIPHETPDESTVIIYEELDLDADVDDSVFTQRGLRRVAQGR